MVELIERKFTFLPSIEHTGSSFVQRLLCNSRGYYTMLQLGRRVNPSKFMVIYEKTGFSRVNSCEELIDFVKKAKFRPVMPARGLKPMILMIGHFGGRSKSFLLYSDVEKLVKTSLSIIPMRDPLLSLLTSHIKCATEHHRALIDGFVFLVELWQKCQENISFLPVDLYAEETSEDKYNKLKTIFNTLGLYHESNDSYIREYIREVSFNWEVIHSVHTDDEVRDKFRASRIKGYYLSGDTKQIAKEIPVGYEYLMSKGLTLRPFLKELGYRNLLWWN